MKVYRGYHLTARDLRLISACDSQVAQFAAEWPDGVDLTLAALKRAAKLRLDLGWFAGAALDAPARKVYYDAIAPARKVYDDACATASKVYDDAIAPARKVY